MVSLDSCASTHISNNVDCIDADKVKANLKISVGEGNELDAQLKGTYKSTNKQSWEEDKN